MNQITWILICDASKARIFVGQKKNQPWTLLESIEHPESRAKGHDLISDRPGSVSQSGNAGHAGGPGKGSRSSMESIPPKQVEHEQFARFISDLLAKGLRDKSYDSLLVVANPHFLGLLRSMVTDQVKKHIKATVDKDYTAYDLKELQDRLSETWMYL